MLTRTVTGPCVVRTSSGGNHPQPPQRSASPAPPGLHPGPACVVDNAEAGGCIRSDCEMCSEMLHRGIVSVRLPCGHVVRAQIIDTDSITASRASGPSGRRSESPCFPFGLQHERNEVAGTSPAHGGIVRQVSLVRNPVPVPSVGILSTLGNQHHHPPAPLSPPRGPASPSSPQQTPAMMYRKATSSLTNFSISREGTGEGTQSQQMTSRSFEKVEKVHRHSSDMPVSDGRRHVTKPTVAEIVTDSRGDVLHRMCNVILLSPQSPDKEQQLKVRGQIIGTYWDERDIGPTLDYAGEVQVMVTYVDPSERSVPLIYPTKHAQTFGDTETADGNVIKWKAALCKVGKKFT